MASPITVAVGAVLDNSRVLLIKRVKEPYVGYWSLPGGKVEADEHVCQTAVRELHEECGIKSRFEYHAGVVSELLYCKAEITSHFIVHVCVLKPESVDVRDCGEGEPRWFDIETLNEIKIIASDFKMLENLVFQKGKHYFDCEMECSEMGCKLIKFE